MVKRSHDMRYTGSINFKVYEDKMVIDEKYGLSRTRQDILIEMRGKLGGVQATRLHTLTHRAIGTIYQNLNSLRDHNLVRNFNMPNKIGSPKVFWVLTPRGIQVVKKLSKYRVVNF